MNHLKQTTFILILASLTAGLLALAAESRPAPGYDGREDHAITLEKALQLTANFRANAGPEQIRGGYFGGQAILGFPYIVPVLAQHFYQLLRRLSSVSNSV